MHSYICIHATARVHYRKNGFGHIQIYALKTGIMTNDVQASVLQKNYLFKLHLHDLHINKYTHIR